MKEIIVKIDGKEWTDAIDAAFNKANKNAKIDGFRPGKAPKDMFIKKYGETNLWLDAADSLVQVAYTKMLDDNKDLEIVAQPEMSLKSLTGEYVEFIFKVTERPEVKLGKYTKLGVKKEDVKVSKEELDHAVDDLRRKYAESVIKDGKVAKGDTAIIDFEGFKDGVAFEGGKGENYPLEIGSNTFIPGFEDQLIGMKKGETKDINVTFPKEYQSEELAGKDAVFKVTVHEIKETILPELNKDFFEDLGYDDVDTEEKLRKELETNIKAHKEHHAEEHFIDELLDKAISNMKVEVPESMTRDELDRMIRQYEDNLKMQGISLEQFYQFTNSNEEVLKDQMKEEAIKRIKSRFLLEEIKKAEKIEATEKEAKEEAKKMAKQYQMDEKEFINVFGGLEMIKYDLEMRKAIEFLKENN